MARLIWSNVTITCLIITLSALLGNGQDIKVSETMEADLTHPRQARQLHRMLDPFGLLGKAGEAVNGAVVGMQNAVEGIGKTIDEGAQHVGKMFEQGAQTIDSAVKEHLSQVNEGMEEAGKVARIVGEDLVESMSTLMKEHLKDVPSGDPSLSAPESPQASSLTSSSSQSLMSPQSSSHQASSLPSSSSSSSLSPEALPLQSSFSGDEDMALTREGMVDGFLRMVGIDPSQIGLMALNVLIFLAEMITSSLIGEDLNEIPETRANGYKFSMFSWLLKNDPQKVDNLLKEAQDPSLPRHIIEKLVSSTGDSTACVQLLVCKMSPIIWGIQGSVKDYNQGRGFDDPDAPSQGIFQTLYNSLPELDDFVRFSQSCETQFPSCPLLSLSDFGL